MFKKLLSEALSKWGLPINDEQLERMEDFSTFLLERNRVMNLTAVKTPEECALRHFADSLFLLTCVELKGKRILDIGTGAGFPGMPLKLYDPTLDITMLDSTAKRIAFINEGLARAGIEGKTIVGRAEEVAGDLAGQFDVVTSRAVAPLNILAELSMPFLRVGGVFAPMKSKNDDATTEIVQSANAILTLGGRMTEAHPYQIGEDSPRQVLVVEKERPTPKGYPRKYSLISKKPL